VIDGDMYYFGLFIIKYSSFVLKTSDEA